MKRIRHENEKVFVKNYFDHDQWVYEPRFFRLSDNTKYTPDFYDIKNDTFIKVVGTRQAFFSNKKKYKKFMQEFPDINILFLDKFGEPYQGGEPKGKISECRAERSKHLNCTGRQMEIKLKKLQCKRCGHKWVPRKEDVRICPKCKSAWWDKEK